MIEINPSRWKYKPLSYQLQGVKDLVKHKVFALFWEMRLRKSKVILDTAGELYQAGELEVLIVACPAQVKDVWLGRQFGEIVKHSFVPTDVVEFDADTRQLHKEWMRQHTGKKLVVIVTSLEFLRQEDENDGFPKVQQLLAAVADLSCWLVVDEASAIGNPTSLQFRSVQKLRKPMQRFTLLDGTPTNGSWEPLFAKFKVMDPMILGLKNSKEFRYRYGVVKRVREGRVWKDKVVGWQRQDDLLGRIKNHAHILEQKDVKGILDLPEFIPGELSCRLSEKTWLTYCQMREEMVAEIETGERSWVNNPSVKVMRLAQICAGFLGGVETSIEKITAEISDEATKAFVDWVEVQLQADPNFKCVVWCRWRPEIERLVRRLSKLGVENPTFHRIVIGEQWGDKKVENFLHPDHPYQGAGIMICQQQAVQYGVSFAKAPVQVYLSQDYSLRLRQQSEQRVQDEIKKIGRTSTLMLEMLVLGPKGQRTITHDIVQALRTKEDVGRRLAERWKQILKEE